MESGHNIALIIVNYNGGDYLQDCLKAVFSQTLLPHRVIVVDNNSTDGSMDSLEEAFPDVETVRLEKNVGFASGNNRALPMCHDCEFVATLNADAFPEEDWLHQLYSAALQFPESASFASLTYSADNKNTLDGAGDEYHTSGLAKRRLYGKDKGDIELADGEVFSACAAAALYRKAALFQVGGFDDDFFCYFEDVDLGFRLRLLGYSCRLVTAARAAHVGYSGAGRHSEFAVYHGHRNMVWSFIKNMPLPLLLLYLPFHIGINIFTVIFFAMRGLGGAALKAKIDALARLPEMIRKRSTIQNKKTASTRSIRAILSKGFRWFS